MKNPDWKKIVDLIHREVVPAIGCTEPIAISLVSARAAEALGRTPERLEVEASGNLLKNGMGVTVPGTGEMGLEIAAAVGALGGDASLGLEVLRGMTAEQVERAKEFVRLKKVILTVSQTGILLYAKVKAFAGSDVAEAVLRDSHANIVSVSRNGQTLYQSDAAASAESAEEAWPLDIARIHAFALAVDFADISFILEAARLNELVSAEGMKNRYGLGVGPMIDANIRRKILSDDIVTYAMKLTAAAADARMAGVMMPVMSNSGSGNQGITCTMPVVACALKLGSTREQLARALILSHLISIHIKHNLGRLSALCGATVASTAAACGYVLLLDGTLEQIEMTIRNMIGDMAGMICDGAKGSCAMKVASCVNAGIQAAMLAMDGTCVDGRSGIVADDIEDCIANLCRLGADGMRETDKVILDIMVNKK